MKILFVVAVIPLILGISYLLTVGMVRLVLWLTHTLFGIQVDWNIWLFGLLVWIALWVLKHTFGK